MDKEEEKKKFLFDFKKEIDDLKNQVNPSKKQILKSELKRKAIVSSKISFKFLKTILPLILAAVISVGGAKFLGLGYPFITDDKKKYLTTCQEIDENGNVDTSYQYLAGAKEVTNVNYFSKWDYIDGEYRRTLGEYSTDDYTLEEILEYFNLNNEISGLLGKIPEPVTERSLEMPSENEAQIKIRNYEVNKEEYIIETESSHENSTNSVLICLLFFLSEVLAALMVFTGERNISKEYIKSVKEKYNFQLSESDKELLTTLLKIKEENYKTLTRRLNDGK